MYIILYHDIINMKYNKYENNKKKIQYIIKI